MQSQILESASGIIFFAQYFFGSIGLLIIFAALYICVTPYNEIREIRDHSKTAPSISFAGAILGFCLPLASAIAHSVSFTDMVIWAAIAMIVQILVFSLLRIIFPQMIKGIAADKLGPALFIGALSLAAGLLNAASMVY
jgi:putative membrane protein